MKFLSWIFGQSTVTKGNEMDIVGLLNGLVATIAELQLKLTDAQLALDEAVANAKKEGFDSRQPEIDAKQAEVDAKSLENEQLKARIIELEGAVPPVDMTPFDQAYVDQKVAEAVASMQAEIDALKARIVELESQPQGPTPEQIEQIKFEAGSAVKAEIKAKLDEFEAQFLA